ncbi:MAG: hypothetical protein HY290_24375 [Planctomycetia bacterium]|nr:hypothetical protein [Planctomycetia bacterium]
MEDRWYWKLIGVLVLAAMGWPFWFVPLFLCFRWIYHGEATWTGMFLGAAFGACAILGIIRLMNREKRKPDPPLPE